jgi:hypothetical protein
MNGGGHMLFSSITFLFYFLLLFLVAQGAALAPLAGFAALHHRLGQKVLLAGPFWPPA